MIRRQVKGRIQNSIIPIGISVPCVRIIDPDRNLFTLELQIILKAVDVGKRFPEKLSCVASV
jgi:hypothetical protein